MKTLTDHLAQYAAYHRDPRNISTHFAGVPMIVLAVATLLSAPSFPVGGLPISPATLVTAATCLFYFRLDLRFGAVMTALLAITLTVAHWLAGLATGSWLTAGIGLFVVGWIIQFVGHYYEGKKPAFVDDIVGLLVGPLFLVAEAAFALGLRPEIQEAVEARAGKVRRRDSALSA
jgi:uncharacterized membrane protein YGL010W